MIVAVTGGKGGVGKSTMALNLGREFDAVVVDADLATADLPRCHSPDLHDVLAGRARTLDALEERDSVAILPSGRTLAGARACDLSVLPEVLGTLDRRFGRVVVDTPVGLARDVGTVLEAADVAMVVTTPEKPAIVDARKTRDLAWELGTPIACVAINRVPDGDFSALLEHVEAAFGAPATLIREQQAVANAQADGSALRDFASDAASLDGFEWVVERLQSCDQRTTGRTDSA